MANTRFCRLEQICSIIRFAQREDAAKGKKVGGLQRSAERRADSRDRVYDTASVRLSLPAKRATSALQIMSCGLRGRQEDAGVGWNFAHTHTHTPVSYTHLTLPTIDDV